MPGFKDLRIVDNFYQTSAFLPMPTLLISTLTGDGETSLGPYSLISPFYDKIKFTDEACMKLMKVPRIFLKTALRGCVDWARKNDVQLITDELMEIYFNDNQ
jgi:hypothetical protein